MKRKIAKKKINKGVFDKIRIAVKKLMKRKKQTEVTVAIEKLKIAKLIKPKYDAARYNYLRNALKNLDYKFQNKKCVLYLVKS